MTPSSTLQNDFGVEGADDRLFGVLGEVNELHYVIEL